MVVYQRGISFRWKKGEGGIERDGMDKWERKREMKEPASLEFRISRFDFDVSILPGQRVPRGLISWELPVPVLPCHPTCICFGRFDGEFSNYPVGVIRRIRVVEWALSRGCTISLIKLPASGIRVRIAVSRPPFFLFCDHVLRKIENLAYIRRLCIRGRS